MPLRALAGILSLVEMSLQQVTRPDGLASTDGTVRLSRKHVLAVASAIVVGIAMSIWLAVDRTEAAPTHYSYLPAD